MQVRWTDSDVDIFLYDLSGACVRDVRGGGGNGACVQKLVCLFVSVFERECVGVTQSPALLGQKDLLY
jgi:hypothetical protein